MSKQSDHMTSNQSLLLDDNFPTAYCWNVLDELEGVDCVLGIKHKL